MDSLRRAWRLLLGNWRTLTGFELLYRALSAAVCIPLLSRLMTLVMERTGYAYLTAENLRAFLRTPAAVAAMIVLTLLLAVYAMLDVSVVLFTLDQSRRGLGTDLPRAVRFGARNALRMLRPSGWLLLPAVLLLIPLLNLGVYAGILRSFSVMDVAWHYIRLRRARIIGLTAAGLLAAAALPPCLYTFHYFTLEGLNPVAALWRSVRVGLRQRLRDVLVFLRTQLLCYVLMLAVVLLTGGAYWLLARRWETGIPTAVLRSLFYGEIFLLSSLTAPVAYACLSAEFYRRAGPLPQPPAERPIPTKRRRLLEGAAVLLAALACGLYLGGRAGGWFDIQAEGLGPTEVAAHRGASAYRPENTMAAFRMAAEQGADWIELDVRQSRDGALFVMHDASLKRTAGDPRNCWDLTWQELRRLRVEGEPIPTLAEVLELAREENLRLIVELKPSGHEEHFELDVLTLLREKGVEEQCLVASQQYRVLERAKAIDPGAKTMYITGFAYGGVDRLEYADCLSVEFSNVTRAIVSRAHNAGKPIYAWTVNAAGPLDRMIRLGVDGVVTDNVPLARERVLQSAAPGLLRRLRALLLEGM